MQIDLLLRFCWQRDLSLVQFLTAPPPVHVPPGAVVQPPRAVPDVVPTPEPRPGARRETVCNALEAALATAGPPVSLRAVAQRLHIESRTLWTYAPDLCQHLVDRRTVALQRFPVEFATAEEYSLLENCGHSLLGYDSLRRA
jgi:hypothetical protein